MIPYYFNVISLVNLIKLIIIYPDPYALINKHYLIIIHQHQIHYIIIFQGLYNVLLHRIFSELPFCNSEISPATFQTISSLVKFSEFFNFFYITIQLFDISQ